MSKEARLRQAREYLGISQAEMAKRLNIKPQSYNQTELGNGVSFSDTLLSEFTALGISMDWVITGRGEMLQSDFDLGWTLVVRQHGVEKMALDIESPDGLDFEVRRRKQNKN
jgi:transcriptional regulator with XRE-family HTH domain